jgi:hypothetical protein
MNANALLTRLAPVGPDVWQAASEIRQPGGVRMPLNMTVIRLPDGLVLVSPVAIDAALADEIRALGEVCEIVSPSCLHHLHLGAASAQWREARVLAPPGLTRKRPDLRIDGELPAETPARWRDLVEVLVVRGAPRLGETVLFHRPSGTLICSDLVFHVTHPANARTRFVLWLGGTNGGRLAQSRAWRWFTQAGTATRDDARTILSWPIRRIALAHGDAISTPDARALLARALAPMAGRPTAVSSPRDH